jgi:hypothetical protein
MIVIRLHARWQFNLGKRGDFELVSANDVNGPEPSGVPSRATINVAEHYHVIWIARNRLDFHDSSAALQNGQHHRTPKA